VRLRLESAEWRSGGALEDDAEVSRDGESWDHCSLKRSYLRTLSEGICPWGIRAWPKRAAG